MTGEQFRAALAHLGMTERAFAARAGIHPTTLSRQITSNRVPAWAEWLVQLLTERREIAERLARL
jgi:transcriptional regulator with XRE-family HTH domain